MHSLASRRQKRAPPKDTTGAFLDANSGRCGHQIDGLASPAMSAVSCLEAAVAVVRRTTLSWHTVTATVMALSLKDRSNRRTVNDTFSLNGHNMTGHDE